ncbi:hypothetical protein [Halomonas salinarum]|uniref:hypothetical protein n=1 Tax=Halomonas salinarum TaxID=1158993 RepID=UPI00143A5BEE|nr:hypothetical protein [Halomonas salinarum]
MAGCDQGSAPSAGEQREETAPTQGETASSVQGNVTTETEKPEPLTEPVSMTVTTQLTESRRLEVMGQTNLPEETRLEVLLERRASGVNWQIRTQVRDGGFVVGPLGPGSGLVGGRYVIRVRMPVADVQPMAVKARIGERGEHLTGPLVTRSPHGLGNIVEYSSDYLFDG